MKNQPAKNSLQKKPPGNVPQSIQERAYELFLKRGQEPGHELEDWLQAERDVRLSRQSH